MKKISRVNGVDIEIDDGDLSTSDIYEVDPHCKELCDEMEDKRLKFIKAHVESMGYKIIDENGEVI